MNTLRFATYLAPNMWPVYAAVTAYVGKRLGAPVELTVGASFDAFAQGQTDVGFICGLPYVQLMRAPNPSVTLLAAPTLQGERYHGAPIYYSDVVVRRESPFRRLADLREHVWAYNDVDSHSGYNLTRYMLAQMGETQGFFSRVVAAGSHQRALRLLVGGEIDGSAIDSQVLAIELRDHSSIAEQIRTIAIFGPSTIQPVVAARRLPEALRADISAALWAMGDDPAARADLDHGFVERFVPIDDTAYDDIRAMLATVEAAHFTVLR